MKKIKSNLLMFGIVLFVLLFAFSMIILCINAFNPLSDDIIDKVIAIFSICAIIALVSILISEAMENEYVEKEKRK